MRSNGVSSERVAILSRRSWTTRRCTGRDLIPRLATTYGLHFAVRDLQRTLEPGGEEDPLEVEVTAAGLKAYASEHTVSTLQACREACGGQGYLAASRFAALKADTDVFTTFEGANLVLYQLVAKGLLSRFRDQMGDLTVGRAMRYLHGTSGDDADRTEPGDRTADR